MNQIIVNNGSILIDVERGDLNVASGQLLLANNGAISLLVRSVTNGSGKIVIGNNASLSTTGKGKMVSLVAGGNTIPKTGTNPFPEILLLPVSWHLLHRKMLFGLPIPGVVEVPIGTANVTAKKCERTI